MSTFQYIFYKRTNPILSGNKMTEMPNWLSSRLYFLKTQGKMNLSGEPRVDLSIFKSPELSKQFSLMKYLDISKTPLESIDDLVYCKRLSHFVANKSQIKTLKNFKVLRSAECVSMIDTPVSKHPNYKLSLLLVVGEQLHLIDGKLIPMSVRAKAKAYSPIAADLIDAGWMAEYPCPPVEQLNQLCQQYGIESSPKATNPIDLHVYSGIEKNLYTGDFETTLSKLKRKHEEMLKQGQALFGIIDDDENEEYATQQISTILNSHGLAVSPNDEDSIIQAVQTLCTLTSPNRH